METIPITLQRDLSDGQPRRGATDDSTRELGLVLVVGRPVDRTARLIVPNPNVMMGKPDIRGTRITVELILEKLSA